MFIALKILFVILAHVKLFTLNDGTYVLDSSGYTCVIAILILQFLGERFFKLILYIVCCISRIWNETWLAGFFYKPCNYELFVKQSLNMEMAIVMARVWENCFITHSYLLVFFSVLSWFVINLVDQQNALHIVTLTSGCWYGLDSSSWYRWINTPGWYSRVFFKTVASWRSRKCWYGHLS